MGWIIGADIYTGYWIKGPEMTQYRAECQYRYQFIGRNQSNFLTERKFSSVIRVQVFFQNCIQCKIQAEELLSSISNTCIWLKFTFSREIITILHIACYHIISLIPKYDIVDIAARLVPTKGQIYEEFIYGGFGGQGRCKNVFCPKGRTPTKHHTGN